jgi:hypothetical protein
VRWRDRLLSQLDTDPPGARPRRGWHPHSSRPRAC